MNEYKFNIRFEVGSKRTVMVDSNWNAITVDSDTFGNCQNFTIGLFAKFLTATIRQDRKKRLKQIKELCGISKPFLTVDVTRYQSKKIKESFHVVKSMNYTNVTGSLISIVIIDTRK